METGNFVKEVIGFNKATFENLFNAAVMVQDQTEKWGDMFLDQAAWFPKEEKQFISEWTDFYKHSCDDFKKAMDENFSEFERAYAMPDSEKRPETPKSTAKSNAIK